MGGDDLASDDEYLTSKIVADSDGSDDDDNENYNQNDNNNDNNNKNNNKRKISETLLSQRGDDSNNDFSTNDRKRRRQDRKIVFELSRSVHESSASEQAEFLSTFCDMDLVQSHHMATTTTTTTSNGSWQERLLQLTSKKKLKKWNIMKSPMIIILALSARRAVSILKELAPLKTRVVKLFAKHLTVQEQETMLSSSSFAIGVGTPHRVSVLCQNGSLSLSSTQLIILDTSHLDPKNFNICTLPDTAVHVKDLFREQIVPELEKRKTLRVAMF